MRTVILSRVRTVALLHKNRYFDNESCVPVPLPASGATNWRSDFSRDWCSMPMGIPMQTWTGNQIDMYGMETRYSSVNGRPKIQSGNSTSGVRILSESPEVHLDEEGESGHSSLVWGRTPLHCSA